MREVKGRGIRKRRNRRRRRGSGSSYIWLVGTAANVADPRVHAGNASRLSLAELGIMCTRRNTTKTEHWLSDVHDQCACDARAKQCRRCNSWKIVFHWRERRTKEPKMIGAQTYKGIKKHITCGRLQRRMIGSGCGMLRWRYGCVHLVKRSDLSDHECVGASVTIGDLGRAL